MKMLLAILAVGAFLFGAGNTSLAQGNLTTLANFNGSNGANPNASVTLSRDGGTLYGTTEYGGSNFAAGEDVGTGTVFAVPVSGGVVTSMASFNFITGGQPMASVILIGNTLCGTTYYGGGYGNGSVFSIPIDGGMITTLANCSDGSNLMPGTNPDASVTLSRDGTTLYGTTEAGGDVGAGTVFSMPVGGGAITTLASFNGSNGGNPTASLILSGDGKTLYGTTYYSGLYSGGTVFSIPVGGGAITTLASFNGTNGEYPAANVILSSDGRTLYGTTDLGGAYGYGTVFSIPVGGGAITTLASFNGSNGANPTASLILSGDGKTLYGTTYHGGTGFNEANSNPGYGTVFSIPVGGGAITTLARFNNNNGSYPAANVILSSDSRTLYGTTISGGTYGYGTVFSLSLYSWQTVDVTVGSDDKTRLLWTKTDGTAGIWTVDNSGNATNLTNIGPFAGWTASSIAASADGLTRMLWNKTDGTAGLWLLNPNNTYKAGFNFGPYAGWNAVDVAVGSDNKTRLLWTKSDGTAGVWTVDNSGNLSNLTNYGPYPGWTATRIAAGSDGYTRLLWNKTDGTAALWILNPNNTQKSGFNFGPFYGTTAVDLTVGADNKTRLLWTDLEGQVAVWTVDNSGNYTNATSFGPNTGWTATKIAVGGDSLSRLLWSDESGTQAFWLLNSNNSYNNGFNYGPY